MKTSNKHLLPGLEILGALINMMQHYIIDTTLHHII